MAERRMFAKSIIDSDAFLDMPLSAQALYFHFAMRADDDGFVSNPSRIMRMINAAKNDHDLLIVKGFVIPFESGVCVIKHWRIHNYLRSDRYKPTTYQEEKASLTVKENGAYTIGIPDGNQKSTEDFGILDEKSAQIDAETSDFSLGIPTVDQGYTDCLPPVDAGKDRLGKDVSKKESKEKEILTHSSAGARAYERESYEELLTRMGFGADLRKLIFEFIRFQQVNKKIVTNGMLEQTMACIKGAAERRIRESLPGGYMANLKTDMKPYNDDVEQYIAGSIRQALDGGWYELREPKGFLTAAEWQAEADKDMGRM